MSNRKLLFFTAFVFLWTTLPFTATASDTPHWVHYKWLSTSPALPRKVVVLPVNVEVVEVTAGGVEEKVPDWSREASENVFKALSTALGKQGLKEVAAPQLSGAAAANLDEHVALYKLVVNTSTQLGWQQKIRHFDYSIGPGLREIADRTGADAAFLVFGRDYASTAGRKAMAVAGNIPIVNAFTGPAPELGHSFVHIGLVDLRSGDLLWMNSNYRRGSTNLRDPGDAAKMVNAIFAWYPGIERYRKAYLK